jgi:threonine/homoserine/homoserine lactone efflux protein
MLSTLATIWLLHVAALVTPGANVLLVSHLSASGSARSAALAAVGVAVGAAIWSGAAVLGVHALFAAFPALRLALQVAGAAYLLTVAWRLWHACTAPPKAPAALSHARAFRLGLLTNLSNPKSALFFGSVFSAALPAQPPALLLCAAVALVVANALAWHLLLAFLFSRRLVQSGYGAQRDLLGRVAGALLGVLGLGLLAAAVRDARS